MPLRLILYSTWIAIVTLGFSHAADQFPEFDFTKSQVCAGWAVKNELAVPLRSREGLVLELCAEDACLLGPKIDLESAEDVWLRVRLRSERGGVGRFWFNESGDATGESILFETPTEKWSEQLLPVPRVGAFRLRFEPPYQGGRCVLGLVRFERAGDSGVIGVRAMGDTLLISARSHGPRLEVLEVPPQDSLDALRADACAPLMGRVAPGTETTMSIPRFDAERDRLFSGFVARDECGVVGAVRFVDEMQGVSKDTEPFPKAASKKGLQVQMVDDALALGVKHAALNVNLAALVELTPAADSLSWKMDGETYYFRRNAVESIQVKPLSDAGVQVSLILLNYVNKDAAVDRVMRPARAPADAPNHITGFNVDSPDGLRRFRACVEFLADRFSSEKSPHGRAVGYIVGNEVNSHWHWYNLGRTPLLKIAEEYLCALRIVHTAVRKSSASARVYVSLDHHWAGSHERDALKTGPGKTLLEMLNRLSKLGGDFDWHVAYHPYPENLFEPRSWLDKTALPAWNSPRITFKNLEQLVSYLRQPEMLCHGEPRRIILSEQGFHSPPKPDVEEGEMRQAAGFCYAYYKVAHLDGIDAFILHRHVDHEHEGGLRLGLWTVQPGSIFHPEKKKRLYEIFRAADTPEWEAAFKFALPLIPIKEWGELLPPEQTRQ